MNSAQSFGSMDLSIIIPAYNEEKRLGYTLTRTCEFLAQRPWVSEIIVVDDGSGDGTTRVAEAFAAALSGETAERVICRCRRNPGNRGKGYSVRRGIEEAAGRVVGFMDADYKTDIHGLDMVMELLEEWPGVVGDRTLSGTRIEVPRRMYRDLGSRLFRWLLRLGMGLRDYPDTQCGFKFFRAEVARELFARQRTDGFMFDVEILLLAASHQIALARMPVTWSDDPDSRFNLMSGSLRNTLELLRLYWWHRRRTRELYAGHRETLSRE